MKERITSAKKTSKIINKSNFSDLQLAASSTRMQTSGKPSTKFPLGGLVDCPSILLQLCFFSPLHLLINFRISLFSKKNSKMNIFENFEMS